MAAALTLSQHLSSDGLLDRFETKAIEWAEQAGIRWVELEGELWTLVSELERKKGVEPGDFAKNTRLHEARSLLQNEPPAALQCLLQVPGVRKASIPTAFDVEGGYALSCGGPGAKAGITAMVRQQIPEWALAGYTLVNVPLALSYLMHGRSQVAKATRDLTIGTTIDVGKAAAERTNAPLAVQQFSGDAEVAALMSQLMAKIHERAILALDTSNRAEVKAERAEAKADRAIDLALTHAQPRLRDRPKQPTSLTRQALFGTWRKHYQGICPCCQVAVDEKNLEIDHWSTRDKADAAHLWLICRGCNTRLGKPELDGGNRRSDLDRRRFIAFQENLNLPLVVQGDLGLSA